MTSVTVYTPENLENNQISANTKKTLSVFLAGTIDNGASVDWQSEVIEHLETEPYGNIIVYNPRRKTWNPEAGHDEVMKQIDWEQRALEVSDFIVMNFLQDSKSPISFLELGLFARSKKIAVFCPKKFYRYDNIEDTCHRYNVELINVNTSKNIAARIKRRAIDKATLG